MSTDIHDALGSATDDEAEQRIQNAITPVPPPEPDPDSLPTIRNARELNLDIPNLPRELIHGVLHKSSVMIYGGGAKTNKTFVLMDMALSVASGLPWLGHTTMPGKVLYIDFELPSTFWKSRLDNIVQEKVISAEHLDNLDVWNLRGHAADISTLNETIAHRLTNNRYDLIVVDPIYKVLGDRDENSAGDITSMMNTFEKMAVDSGAAIVLGHHFSKGNQSGKESMDRVSGSGVFSRSPDALVTITRHEIKDAYVVDMTLRHLRSPEPFGVVWKYPMMERDTDIDPSKLKRAGAAQRKFTDDQVVALLNEKPLTTTEWKNKAKDDLNMGDGTFNNYKKQLVEKARVRLDEGKWRIGPPEVQRPQTPPAPQPNR